jgi:hypothetical protein
MHIPRFFFPELAGDANALREPGNTFTRLSEQPLFKKNFGFTPLNVSIVTEPPVKPLNDSQEGEK